MDLRLTVEKKLQQKRKELAELELKCREHVSYIKALEDVIRVADEGPEGDSDETPNIRAGSDVGKTRDLLKKNGRALHIDDILKGIGRDPDKKNRASLASTLANYVRKGFVFSRPEPNTFGLLEFVDSRSAMNRDDSEPPDDFGEGITDEDVPF